MRILKSKIRYLYQREVHPNITIKWRAKEQGWKKGQRWRRLHIGQISMTTLLTSMFCDDFQLSEYQYFVFSVVKKIKNPIHMTSNNYLSIRAISMF